MHVSGLSSDSYSYFTHNNQDERNYHINPLQKMEKKWFQLEKIPRRVKPWWQRKSNWKFLSENKYGQREGD